MDRSISTLRDRGWRRTAGRAALLALLLLMAGAGRLGAADFIRGDANNDGRLSISDCVFTWKYLYRDLEPSECVKAADYEDDGHVSLSDVISLHYFLTMKDGPPAPPFPGPGPDPNPDPLPCPSYGSGSPLVDPAAEMSVLPSTAPGGTDPRARITITVSSTGPLFAYQGTISFPPGVISDVGGYGGSRNGVGLRDLTGVEKGVGVPLGRAEGGRIAFSYLRFSNSDGVDVPIPGGMRVAVLEIPVCLAPGTRAGEYAVTLESAELADEATGRAIEPHLVSGTLSVLEEVGDTECLSVFSRPEIDAEFKLGEGEAAPGQSVSIPFSIRSSAGVGTYEMSVDFDEEVLLATAIELRWRFVDRDDFSYLYIGFDNHNETPGSAGVDEGYFYAAVVPREELFIPPDTEVEALELQFQVKVGAPAGASELRFLDRPLNTLPGNHFGAENYIHALGGRYSPQLSNSFILTNGRVNIVPDATPFVRGDSNGDNIYDVSDAPFTLSYLFLAGEAPLCPDAADTNDDGAVDLADPITALQHLFLAGEPPSAPFPAAGPDPTADRLGCAHPPR